MNDDEPMTPEEFNRRLNDPDYKPDNPIWQAIRHIMLIPLQRILAMFEEGEDDDENE